MDQLSLRGLRRVMVRDERIYASNSETSLRDVEIFFEHLYENRCWLFSLTQLESRIRLMAVEAPSISHNDNVTFLFFDFFLNIGILFCKISYVLLTYFGFIFAFIISYSYYLISFVSPLKY